MVTIQFNKENDVSNISLNQLSNEGYTFAVIKIDETEYWREDIAKAARLIYGVYLVDLTEPTHCCELSTSFPAENIKNFFPHPSQDLPEDTLLEYEYSSEYLREDVIYINGSNKYKVEKLYRSEDGNKDEIIEYEFRNPSV